MKPPGKKSDDLQKQIVALKERLQYQELELARISVAAMEKAARINHLIEVMSSLDIDPEVKQDVINSCQELVNQNQIEQPIWSDASEADTEFLSKLQKRFPDLTQKELRILQLVKFGHSNAEIGPIIGISARGVESIRYRMHKRLGLNYHQTLKTFLDYLDL